MDEVAHFAGALCSLGVTSGDRVLVYMPMVNCIILERQMLEAELVAGRDIDWREAVSGAEPVACVPPRL